jgi:hypothetical protein
MPEINCSECGKTISLLATTYWNVENADIKCGSCNAILTITLDKGELKKIRTREPTTLKG